MLFVFAKLGKQTWHSNLAFKLGIQQVQIPSVPFANLWFSSMVRR